MSSDISRICTLLRDALCSKAPALLPEDLQDESELVRLYEELLEFRRFVMSIAVGDLSISSDLKGYAAGALKTLQAHLKHMTWQTQMIASGDFSQRLDFMGEFSKAFNAMTTQLEASLRIIKEHEQELNRINAGLKKEIECREQIQAALIQSEAHYRNLTETMKDVVWILDSETLRFLYISPSVERLLGYSVDEFLLYSLDETLSPAQALQAKERIQKNRRRFLSGTMMVDEYQTFEVEHTCKDGTAKWTEAVTRYVRNERTGAVEIHGVTRDISERRALSLELVRQATTDSLTGIANRRHFLSILQNEMKRCQRHFCPLSLLMLDIDHFKHVNDTYGHAMGDRALQAVAAVCAAQLRSCDLVGRIGGEEFALMLVQTDQEEACVVAARLLERVEACDIQTDDNRSIRVTVSIGVAEHRPGPETSEELLARVDKALYQAKENGRNRLECYG